MTFDRVDVCEAWYLYLSTHHTGQGSREYARLSKLLKHFRPRPSLRSANDLTTSGLEIYLRIAEYPHDFVDCVGEGHPLFEMWAGAYAQARVLIRADSFEAASEALFEWLDDNAPGLLHTIDYDEAARELGFPSFEAAELAGKLEEVVENAEMDMTVCGHTTLRHGDSIPSWGWGGDEVVL